MDINSLTYRELTFRDLVSMLFRQKRVIILTISIIMLNVLIGLLFQTPYYESTVTMHIKGVSNVEAETYQGIGAYRIHLTQMQIAHSDPVLKRAVKSLKLDMRPIDYEMQFCHPLKRFYLKYALRKVKADINLLPPEAQKEFYVRRAINILKENIRTELLPHTDIFTITVKDFSPDDSAAIANVVSRSFAIYDMQQQIAELTQRYGELHPTVMQLRDNIVSAETRLSGEHLSDIEAIGTASVKIVEQATRPFEPSSKPRRTLFIIAFCVSCFLAFALAVLFDFIDQRFKSPEDIVKYFNIPFIGSIPVRSKRESLYIKDATSRSSYISFYEDLSEQLFIFMKTQGIKTVIVTSQNLGSENSTIVANLGYCLSKILNHKTIIVDANLRDSYLSDIYNISKLPGLSGLLESNLIEYQKPLMLEEKTSTITGEQHYDTEALSQTTDAYDSTDSEENRRYASGDLDKQKRAMLNSLLENKKHNIAANLDNTVTFDTSYLASLIRKIDTNLHILPSGTTLQNPVVLLEKITMSMILGKLKDNYEIILVDSPTLQNVADTIVLSSHVDGVMLIIDGEKDRRQVLNNTLSTLKAKNINIIGFVMNNRKFVIPKFIYKRL